MSALGASDFKSRQAIADALLRVVRLVRAGQNVESVFLERTREAVQVPPQPRDEFWRFKPGPLETYTLHVRHRP